MWTSTQTLADLSQRLSPCRRILILTHLKPDGDAVGSTLGMARALEGAERWSSGRRTHLWYYGPPPPWLAEMCGSTPFTHVSSKHPVEQAAAELGGEPDAILVLDTGAWSQLEPVAEYLASRRHLVMCVDHHAQGSDDLAPARFIDASAASACQLAAELARLVLGKASTSELPREVAQAFYLGLGTDTGWFRHSNVDPRAMRDAAALLEAGADHVRLCAMTEQNSLGRVRLIGKALATLELHCEGRLAIMHATRADLLACEATPGDTGGITDFSQSLPGVRVSAMLVEAMPGDFGRSGDAGILTKISLRSKAIEPLVDVNAVAGHLGGGGHVRAAGARMEADIETTRRRVIELVDSQLRQAPSR
jgi:phosphoesterase RecJ-like protein